MFIRVCRRRDCRDCRHYAEQYFTGLHGQGLYKFGFCQVRLHDLKVVEPDIERLCGEFEGKGLEPVPDEEPEKEPEPGKA